jgi:hypothetical protein
MLQVIKAAPLAVLLCLGIASYGAFYLTSAFNWRQIENLKTQNSEQQTDIGLLNDRISTLQQSGSSIPPSQWRRLTDAQRNKLLDLLSRPENKFQTVVIYAIAESEPRQFASQFVDILNSAGTHVIKREVPLNTEVDVGLMIGVGDINNPPPEAKRITELLQLADIDTHYTWWVRQVAIDNAPVNFDLYVGPKPW